MNASEVSPRGASALLVCAGEPSGDWMGARVVSALQSVGRCAPFGMGGPALRAQGLDALRASEGVTAMGLTAPLRRIGALASARRVLLEEVQRRRATVALLVGFSEFNARLGWHLRRRGVRVLWYGPPQVWAWRPERARRLATAADRFALLLPFEAALWRHAGARAEFVGHPSVEAREAAEPDGTPRPHDAPGMRVALLPGSRGAEIRRHLPVMLRVARRLRGEMTTYVVGAPGLALHDRRWLESRSRAEGVRLAATDGPGALPDADVAVCASGTATLDCVAAGVPPVIVYRTDPLTYAVARRVVRTRRIGLPNVLLDADIFPELIQDALEPAAVVARLRDVARRRTELVDACARVRRLLAPPTPVTPSRRVADTLASWLWS